MRKVWAAMDKPTAQSDDCYSRISFQTIAGGDEVEGVLGWREGVENRVVFQVWDGPSFAAEGADLAAAFGAARAGIMRAGFSPRAPSDGGLGELFAAAEAKNAGSRPRFRPLRWLLVVATLVVMVSPTLARAEILARAEAATVSGSTCEWRLVLAAGMSRTGAVSEQDRGEEDGREVIGLSRTVAPDITLPQAPALSRSAAAFDTRLRDIAAARDIAGFMALLTDDVLVSFGGNGGKVEFAAEWKLETERGRAAFWAVLDRLLAHGGWNEAGDAEYPQRQTYPWFFTAWPDDADAENSFIANDGAVLRAGPDAAAAVLARLPRAAVLRARAEAAGEAPEWDGHGWLDVTAPGGAFGYVRQDDVTPLLGVRLVAVDTESGWRIEAMVSGD